MKSVQIASKTFVVRFQLIIWPRKPYFSHIPLVITHNIGPGLTLLVGRGVSKFSAAHLCPSIDYVLPRGAK